MGFHCPPLTNLAETRRANSPVNVLGPEQEFSHTIEIKYYVLSIRLLGMNVNERPLFNLYQRSKVTYIWPGP